MRAGTKGKKGWPLVVVRPGIRKGRMESAEYMAQPSPTRATHKVD